MSGLLASVCSTDEAQLALRAYADIVDCKNPFEGALGALPPETIARIVRAVDGERATSATTGDDVRSPRRLIEAIHITADCGVDYIKFGLFDKASARPLIEALPDVAAEHALIAVCFADRYDPADMVDTLFESGIRGIMIDTADKGTGPLTSLWDLRRIAAFIDSVRNRGLLCGLAGRLGLDDIPGLLPLQADYLGFRSALCGGNRHHGIDAAAAMRVRQAIPFRIDTRPLNLQGVSRH